MKTSSSERGTINGVMVGKDGTGMVTTPSDSKDIPPFCRLPANRASPYWYIENPRQHMCTDMADIEDFLFTSSYPEERAKYAATVPTVSDGEVGGIIPALPATPEKIQSMRSGVVCHRGIKVVAVNGSSGWSFLHPTLTSLTGGGEQGPHEHRGPSCHYFAIP